MQFRKYTNGGYSKIGAGASKTRVKIEDIIKAFKEDVDTSIVDMYDLDITKEFFMRIALGNIFRVNQDGECPLLDFLCEHIELEVLQDIVVKGSISTYMLRRRLNERTN